MFIGKQLLIQPIQIIWSVVYYNIGRYFKLLINNLYSIVYTTLQYNDCQVSTHYCQVLTYTYYRRLYDIQIISTKYCGCKSKVYQKSGVFK